jgi:hypothetical protein
VIKPLASAILAALLGLPAVAAQASAADPEIVDVQIDAPERVTVGDRVPVQIKVEADRGTNVALVQASLPPEVEIATQPATTSRSMDGGRQEITIAFELAPFVTGEVMLPPMVLRYSMPGGASGQLETPASRILVASVLSQQGELAPRDLKPQAEIAAGGPGWVGPAVAAAGLALIVTLALIVWRQRVLRSRPVPAATVLEQSELGPEDKARAALDQAGAHFAEDGDYVAYYAAIATTTRRYLSERHGFPAFALTTRELQAAMRREGIDRWQLRVAGGLLQQCDSVVYAHYRPAGERADADLTAAYEIVEMSRPQVAEEVEVA